jgi:hypothetical protein
MIRHLRSLWRATRFLIAARLGLLPRCDECGDLIDEGTICEACWAYQSHTWPY